MIFLIAIFLSLIAVFVLLKKATEKDESPAAQNEVPTDDSGCCGAHEVCEKDSLLNTQNKFEYYDDEELDQFAGMKSEEYSETDIEEFCK
ncbi:MAG: phospholipase, partial [Paludibacteraceae bacterium]|nr:phospholipase [Paludibacteraceae bacterium]